MAFNGITAGGFVEGFNANRQLDQKDTQLGLNARGVAVQEEALRIRERELKREDSRKSVLAADKTLQGNLDIIVKRSADLRKANVPPEKIRQILTPFIEAIPQFAPAAGRDPKRLMSLVELALSAPSGADEARAEARNKIAAADAIAEDPEITRRDALTAEGLIPKPPRPNIINLESPDGKGAVALNTADPAFAERFKELSDRGFTKITKSAQRSTIETVTGPDKILVRESREKIARINGDIEESQITLQKFTDNPEAGGLVGKAIDVGGGLVEQVPLVGKKIIEMLGIDTRKVSEARTQALITVSRLLTTITQETSRFTDEERRIAKEAQKALRPEASTEQIVGALGTVIQIQRRDRMREADKLRSFSGMSIDDLGTDAGLQRLGNILTSNGMNEDQAIETIIDLRRRFGFASKKGKKK